MEARPSLNLTEGTEHMSYQLANTCIQQPGTNMSHDTEKDEKSNSAFLCSTDPETGSVKYGGLKPEVLKMVDDFPVHEDDVYLCGYPKSGNYWVGVIIAAIMRQDEVETFQESGIRDPPLVIEIASTEAIKRPHPGLFKSHLRYDKLPKGVREKQVKIVNITRNPKDVAVSYFHFHKFAKHIVHFAKPWDEYLEDFLEGKVPFDSYFDHVGSFWKIRHQPHVMLVQYEDLKENPRRWIAEIAKFLEIPLSKERLEKIAELTDFQNMKQTTHLNPSRLPVFLEGGAFLRNGQVGDWRSMFTEEQKEKMDEEYRKFCQEIGRPVDSC